MCDRVAAIQTRHDLAAHVLVLGRDSDDGDWENPELARYPGSLTTEIDALNVSFGTADEPVPAAPFWPSPGKSRPVATMAEEVPAAGAAHQAVIPRSVPATPEVGDLGHCPGDPGRTATGRFEDGLPG